MRRILLVLLLSAAALVAPSLPHARACSCATFDVGERLAGANGAFVGSLVSRDDPQPAGDGSLSSATLVRNRYQVERAVKGDISSGTIDVWSAWSGASCGLETSVGRRAGLLLRRDGGQWLSGLCDQADPDALLRAGQPLPPTGNAPPAGPDGADGEVVALSAPDSRAGTSGRPLLAGGAGAGLIASGLAGLIRRRRPRNCPRPSEWC